MAARTDIHRIGAIDPADYDEIGFEDRHPDEGGTWWADGATDGATFFADKRELYDGRCETCGAGPLRFAVYFKQRETGEIIAVGEDCAANLSLGTRSAMDRRTALARKLKADTIALWLAEGGETAREADAILDAYRDLDLSEGAALDGLYTRDGFERFDPESDEGKAGEAKAAAARQAVHDFIGKGNGAFLSSLYSSRRDRGYLSFKQANALISIVERAAKWTAEREAEIREPVPVTDKRIEITGTVLSSKWKDTDYGDRQVMTVKDDRNFIVWGSVPGSLQGDWDADGEFIYGARRGDRITFTAAIEVSDRDECFGFFKRPTKAEFLERAEHEDEDEG